MRTLILSCNTGEGHNSCAKALKEVFDKNGETCVIKDALGFISEKTSRFISWGHVFLYRNMPELFNKGYVFTEKHTDIFSEKNMMYNFFGKGADDLFDLIVKENYDTVVCTHPFAALMLTEVKNRYELSAKTAFVATDYTCSPSVKDSELDLYFIPDKLLADEFVCENIPKEKIVASGIPIRQMFYSHIDKTAAKLNSGIQPERKHLVMMCGSMGCGPIEKLAEMLTERARDDFELTVVCGTNDKLKAQIEEKCGTRPNLHVLGYVKDMSAMLDSADLYLTKPGGLSVTEAATKKLPMIFIDAVAGCETYNSDFYVRLGCAKRGGDTDELVKICASLLTDENAYSAMLSAFDGLQTQNASECIYNALKEEKTVSEQTACGRE